MTPNRRSPGEMGMDDVDGRLHPGDQPHRRLEKHADSLGNLRLVEIGSVAIGDPADRQAPHHHLVLDIVHGIEMRIGKASCDDADMVGIARGPRGSIFPAMSPRG